MGDFAEKALRELINNYKLANTSVPSGTFIELEIKTQDNPRDVFERVFAGAKADSAFTNGRLELSVNIISDNVFSSGRNDQTSYVRKIVFSADKTTDEYYHKTSLASPVRMNDFIKYNVTLSQEVVREKFNTSPNAVIRFKLRATFDFTHEGHEWRLDLTAVKRGAMNEMNKGNLGMIKKQLNLDTITIDNFLKNLNYNLIDKYEIEIEYAGKPSEVPLTPNIITGAARRIFGLVNAQYIEQMAYREELYNIATYIMPAKIHYQYRQDNMTLKQLATQAIPITRNKYISDIYPMRDYLLTIKADGERSIVVVENGHMRIITTGLVEIASSQSNITIVDCEFLAARSPPRIRIFDVMVIDGENISELGMEERITHIPRTVEILTTPEYEVIPAVYTTVGDDLEASLREIYDTKYDMPTDGIIASKPGNNYRDTLNYKWKPYEMNTIDFLAVKCPDSMLGPIPYAAKPGYTIYLLFVGISQQYREQLGIGLLSHYKQLFHNTDAVYYPIQFSPSYDPLAYIYYVDDDTIKKYGDFHHKIIELSLDVDGGEVNVNADLTTHKWIFHRIREDRKMASNYYGNNFRTAELTYLNYIDKFSFEQLYNPGSGYFASNATGIHSAPNKYKRWVISTVFKNNLYGAKRVIDLAAGRGADLNRYNEIKVGHVLFIDIDPLAISELISRKFTMHKPHSRARKQGGGDFNLDNVIRKDVRGMTIHTLVADLKTPEADLVAKTYQYGFNVGTVDGMVCNFALHYMCDTLENLRNLLIFISRMLKRGGLFYASVMNGKAIFELLKGLKYGETWLRSEDNVPKYEIKKMYREDKLAKTGQMIHIRLPFTEELVPEPLCNIENLISEAAKVGLQVEINDSMGSYMTKFSKLDNNIYGQLTDDDCKYIELFTSISFRRV